MRKNKILFAIGAVLLFSAALVAFYAKKEEAAYSPRGWKDDFRWFNCEMIKPNGEKINIEVGIPLQIIKLGKDDKVVNAKSPVDAVSNRYFFVKNMKKQEDIEKLKQLYCIQVAAFPMDDYVEKYGFEKALEFQKKIVFPGGDGSEYILYCLVKYEDIMIVSEQIVTSSNKKQSFFLSETLTTTVNSGEWRVLISDNAKYDAIVSLISNARWKGNDLLADCWKKVYGKDFKDMYPFDDKNPVAKPEKKTK